MTGLHARLKLATDPAHARLDSHPRLARLMDPSLSLREYAEALASLGAAVLRVEAALRASPGLARTIPRFDERFRGAALAADLDFLARERGIRPAVVLPAEALAPLVGALREPGGGLGTLYVLEGSTLGGAFLAKAVHASLGLSPGRGASFFGGRGPLTPVLWRELLQAFREADAHLVEKQRADATAAAQATFATFAASLEAPVEFC